MREFSEIANRIFSLDLWNENNEKECLWNCICYGVFKDRKESTVCWNLSALCSNSFGCYVHIFKYWKCLNIVDSQFYYQWALTLRKRACESRCDNYCQTYVQAYICEMFYKTFQQNRIGMLKCLIIWWFNKWDVYRNANGIYLT